MNRKETIEFIDYLAKLSDYELLEEMIKNLKEAKR